LLFDILLVMSFLVLALFHFKFPFSDLLLNGIRTCLLHQSALLIHWSCIILLSFFL
jgi:hypothetical protein